MCSIPVKTVDTLDPASLGNSKIVFAPRCSVLREHNVCNIPVKTVNTQDPDSLGNSKM